MSWFGCCIPVWDEPTDDACPWELCRSWVSRGHWACPIDTGTRASTISEPLEKLWNSHCCTPSDSSPLVQTQDTFFLFKYTRDDSDVIMFIIVTAAMLKIYYVAAVQRRKPKYAWKLLCAKLYINRQSKYSIFKSPWPIFALFIDIEHTSNIAAWFYTQFNDVTAAHVYRLQ